MDTNNLETFALPESQQRQPIQWGRITPDEWPLILACAGRAMRMLLDIAQQRGKKHLAEQMQTDAQTIAMDIAVAHLARGIDLLAFHEAPADVFLADVTDIILNVNRIDGALPEFVHLRCAKFGATKT